MPVVIDEVEATVEAAGSGAAAPAAERPYAPPSLERLATELRRVAARERRLRVD